MSGWIKLEKDLETDPRTLRIVATVWPRNGGALPSLETRNGRVTQVVGALARLWIFADSHARDDNTLGMGADEIDQWLGLPGFCRAMPEDWMQIIDESSVELPNYQEKNGVEAKSRAVTQKRVERHRKKHERTTVTSRNGAALPDQTRPDQTKTPESGSARTREPNGRGGPEGNGIPPPLVYSDRLTELPQQSAADCSDAWLDTGCDPQAMRAWLAHKLASGKPLPPHAAISAGKLLLGMGPPETQRAAVQLATANNWQFLRPQDGSQGAPTKRSSSASDRITWRPDPEEERRALEATGAK